MNLQNVTVRFACERAKLRIVQPCRQRRDDKTSWMNSPAQHSQPCSVSAEILSRTIEIELELLEFHIVIARFA